MKTGKGHTVLHLDGAAGLTVGVLLLVLHDWVAGVYQLPASTILMMATANVCYGIYAWSLACADQRRLVWVVGLVMANTIWLVVCVGIVLMYAQTASLIGLMFIGLEGTFVGVLALLEWNGRHGLAQATCQQDET